VLEPLPIDGHLSRIVAVVRERRFAVVCAPPGSGKTTRIPPALLELGPVILLQPRRVAARSLARRIAEERGFSLGEEIGWQVRFERRFSTRTRLLVCTEGILTARLQSDPLLSGFAVVVVDEFHERSLHADLALALARQAARARDDLRIVVMSATLDAAPVAEFLGGCSVLEAGGRPHPLRVSHAPGLGPAQAVREALSREGRHALVFLPGAPEIRRLLEELRRTPLPAEVLPLHGSLDPDAQDRALAPSPERKVILATNIAETSLTVEDVQDVIDSGLHKVLRYDPSVALDRLLTERISRDSAEQRAGRAGRTGPGRVLRLWDERDHLRERREAEIERVDLAGPILQVLAWGGDPLLFEWFEPPPEDRARAAMELLTALGAAKDGRITPLGRTLNRFPLHPRLARVLLDAGGAREAANACAVLSEGWSAGRPALPAGDSDALALSDAISSAPESVRRAARDLTALAARVLGDEGSAPLPPGREDPAHELFLRALLAGYPDRVARRRAPGSDRVLLASGHGARLARESGLKSAEWLVALEVRGAAPGSGEEALVRTASRIEPAWLASTRRAVEHRLERGVVRAVEEERYEALVLAQRAVAPDPQEAARLLAAAIRERGLGEAERALLRRLRFAGIPWDEEEWMVRACAGRVALRDVDLPAAIPRPVMRDLERLAPESIPIPSGRRARIEYRDDGSAAAAVKLQELFGLAATPRVGARGEPLTLLLLAPNGRPVQTTRDLGGFWERVYPEVRRELRGRYPKHPWPEDPWSAPPTHRTKARPKGKAGG